jgi:hypothetical protein
MSKLRIKEIDDLIGVLCRAPHNIYCDAFSMNYFLIKKKDLFFIKDYSIEMFPGTYPTAMINFHILALKTNKIHKHYMRIGLSRAYISSSDVIHVIHKAEIISQVTGTMIPFSKYISGGAPKKQKVIGTKYQEIKNKSSD